MWPINVHRIYINSGRSRKSIGGGRWEQYVSAWTHSVPLIIPFKNSILVYNAKIGGVLHH